MTTPERTELLPCPHCGKSVAELWDGDEDAPGQVCVVCNVVATDAGCGATGGYDNTPEAAIERWNRRASQERSGPVAEIASCSPRDGMYLTHCNVRLRVYNGYVPTIGDEFYTAPLPSPELVKELIVLRDTWNAGRNEIPTTAEFDVFNQNTFRCADELTAILEKYQ